MTHSIGILVVGEPPAELAGRFPGYGTMLEELLHAADGALTFRQYDVRAGQRPAAPDAHDGWLITGSRHAAYEDLPWIHWLAGFIRELDARKIPLVGICFGHQLIARALGGEVVKAPQGWGVGVHEAGITAPAPWIDDDATGFDILMTHQDQVTVLPDGAEVLASAPYCPVGAYRVDDHLFCVQGHPEFVAPLSAYLAEKRRERIGDDVVDAALASLDRPLDHADVVDWIGRFYRLDRA